MTIMFEDKYVSPYLLRPLRSYEEALRDRQRHSPRANLPGDAARGLSFDVGSKEAGVRPDDIESERR